jgi:hypothetical protein
VAARAFPCRLAMPWKLALYVATERVVLPPTACSSAWHPVQVLTLFQGETEDAGSDAASMPWSPWQSVQVGPFPSVAKDSAWLLLAYAAASLA